MTPLISGDVDGQRDVSTLKADILNIILAYKLLMRIKYRFLKRFEENFSAHVKMVLYFCGLA